MRPTENELLTRREILALGAAGLAGLGVAPLLAAAEGAAKGPTLHVYSNYAWLRGFSIIPSGRRIEEAWWSYHPDRFREEVALTQRVHANCLRLWIEFSAWMADPDRVTANFLDAVQAIGAAGIKTMPCLFNRWHDDRWDYGGTYTETLYRDWGPQLEYVRALVTPLARDPRVLIWDLCNEPQANSPSGDTNAKEVAWLRAVAETVRAAGAQQPITIGTMTGDNITTFAPLMDVLCGHPYGRSREELAQLIESFQVIQRAHGKPFLVNECVPGCLDDAKRAATARYYTEMLPEAGFGWMGWSVKEGKAISTRRDRYDGNGIDGQGFHAWFDRAGKLRPGLEFLTEQPRLAPPY